MAKNISRRKFLKNAVIGGAAIGSGLGGYRITYGQAKKAAGPIKIGGQGATSGAHAGFLRTRCIHSRNLCRRSAPISSEETTRRPR